MNGGILNTGSAQIGDEGRGLFTQNDGVYTTGPLTLGDEATGDGTYWLINGELSTEVTYVGPVGKGRFVQDGGINSISTWLGIYKPEDSYELNGGLLMANEIINAGMFLTTGGSIDTAKFTNSYITEVDATLVEVANISGSPAKVVFENSGALRLFNETDFGIAGDLDNSGILAVDAAARLVVDDDLFLSDTSLLYFVIGGILEGEYGQIMTGNNALIDGELQVVLDNGFSPLLNDSFDLLTASSLSGSFNAFNLPGLSEGLAWEISYLNDDPSFLNVVRLGIVAVPLPAAFWLLSSGLFGLICVGRRNKS